MKMYLIMSAISFVLEFSYKNMVAIPSPPPKNIKTNLIVVLAGPSLSNR